MSLYVVIELITIGLKHLRLIVFLFLGLHISKRGAIARPTNLKKRKKNFFYAMYKH